MSLRATYALNVSHEARSSDTSRVTGWRSDVPHNALPPLATQRAHFETLPILRACIQARAALAELKQAAELIPNQDVLIGTIPLLEAQASSEIENIVTHDRLFRMSRHQEEADPASKEASATGTRCWRGTARCGNGP